MSTSEEELQTEVEVLVAQAGAERTAILWRGGAEIRDGIERGRLLGRLLTVFIIYLWESFFIQPCPLVAIDRIILVADDRVSRRVIQLENIHRCLYINVGHLVLIVSIGHVRLPREILGTEYLAIQGDFHTTVVHLAIVDGIGAITPALGRNAHGGSQEVGSLLVVILDGTIEAILEEGEVDTDIEGVGLLPTQIRIGTRLHITLGTAHMTIVLIVCHHIRCRILRHVTGDTIRDTELQMVDPIYMEELFLADNPAGTHRPNRLVLILGTSAPKVRTVPTQTTRHAITVVVGISGIAINRHEAIDILVRGSQLRLTHRVVTQHASNALQQVGIVDHTGSQHLRIIVEETIAV